LAQSEEYSGKIISKGEVLETSLKPGEVIILEFKK